MSDVMTQLGPSKKSELNKKKIILLLIVYICVGFALFFYYEVWIFSIHGSESMMIVLNGENEPEVGREKKEAHIRIGFVSSHLIGIISFPILISWQRFRFACAKAREPKQKIQIIAKQKLLQPITI